jgi:hypothetical protein
MEFAHSIESIISGGCCPSKSPSTESYLLGRPLGATDLRSSVFSFWPAGKNRIAPSSRPVGLSGPGRVLPCRRHAASMTLPELGSE